MLLTRILAISALALQVLASCIPNRPAFDLALSIGSPPPIGDRVELNLAITNLRDAPIYTQATIELPAGIELMDGALSWSGNVAVGATEILKVGIVYPGEGSYVVRGRVTGSFDTDATAPTVDVEAGTALQIEVSPEGVTVGSPVEFLTGTKAP